MNGYLVMSILCSGDLQYLLVGVVIIISLDGMGLCVILFLVNGWCLLCYLMVLLEQGGLIDLGGILFSFVECIELVCGGVLVIYGVDVMFGVVNIILCDQVDGFEVMLQIGLSGCGDVGQYCLQVVIGGVCDGGDCWFVGVDLYCIDYVVGDCCEWYVEILQYLIGVFCDGCYWLVKCCEGLLKWCDGVCWFDSVCLCLL